MNRPTPPIAPPKYIKEEIIPPLPPQKIAEIIIKANQIFPSSDKNYTSLCTFYNCLSQDLTEEDYKTYQIFNGENPYQIINDEYLGNYKDVRKNISFGTDIIGIILNIDLLKSDNIFEDPKILNYRMFSSYKNMYNYITNNEEYMLNITSEEEYKKEILTLCEQEGKASKLKKLMEISKTYDDNICSIFSCNDGISCVPSDVINNTLNYYNKTVYDSSTNGISNQRNKANALYGSTHNLNVENKNGETVYIDSEKNFYRNLYFILKNNFEQKDDFERIPLGLSKNKKLLNELFLYYKPLCNYETSYNPSIIDINQCMSQYERLINKTLYNKGIYNNYFYFHGCYEITNVEYRKPEFMVDFNKIRSEGYRYIGYIFVYPVARIPKTSDFCYNYITLYIDTNYFTLQNDLTTKFYFVKCFEPSEIKNSISIQKFINQLFVYNQIQPSEVNIITNEKPLRQKYKYLNNATYAIIALIALAYGIDFNHFCALPIYDKFLNQIKKIMFADKLKYTYKN